jgi:hypothetical protein
MQDLFQFAIDPTAALDAMVMDLLRGRTRGRSEEALLGKAHELLGLLRYYKGAANAKPLAQLAEILKVTPRELKQHARTLTVDFGIPIGASRQEPYGYYLCVTPADYEAARRPYVHEISSLAQRLQALQPPPRLLEILGQLQIELTEEGTTSGC